MIEVLAVGIARILVSILRLISDWWTRRRQGPAERLRHVLAMKKQIDSRLWKVLSETNGDAIIRELRRKDTYPDLDESLSGISPWFKVELKGTYYAGVEVILSVQKVVIKNKVARAAADLDDPEARNVYVVGRIPYSVIEGVDWEGDEYYGFTHLFCRFRAWGRGPYTSTELYDVEGHDLGGGHIHHEHLEGVRWKPKRQTIIGRWRDRRRRRKVEREAERAASGS